MEILIKNPELKSSSFRRSGGNIRYSEKSKNVSNAIILRPINVLLLIITATTISIDQFVTQFNISLANEKKAISTAHLFHLFLLRN